MTGRSASRLAWSLWGLFVAVVGARIPLSIASGTLEWEVLTVILAFGIYATVGAVVASRGHRMGWFFLSSAVLLATLAFSEGYAEYTFVTNPGALPGGTLAAWLRSWLWSPSIGTFVFFSLLLFPDGRLASPRWRPVAWAAGGLLALLTLAWALNPTIEIAEGVRIRNPIGIPGVDAERLEGPLGLPLAVVVVAAAISLLFRFRRSRGEERQQLKWFAYAAVLIGAWILIEALLPDLERVIEPVLFPVALLSLPLATGVAILRYRLYEIDRIINRTVVYAALTGVLGAAYFGIVVVLQRLLSPLAGGSDLAVAGSTLAVAALFRPARRRIQALVDRRFYRRKYDAAKTVEAFTARLRDEIDLDTLRYELTEVVRETMQPAHVSLWLRPQEQR